MERGFYKSVLVGIAIICLVCGCLNQSSNQQPTSQKENTQDVQKAEGKQMAAEQQKVKKPKADTAQKAPKTKAAKPAKKLTQEQVDTIVASAVKSKSQKPCKSIPQMGQKIDCLVEVSSAVNDIGPCKILSGKDKATCISKATIEIGDISKVKCHKLPDQSYLDECVMAQAQDATSPKPCKPLQGKPSYDECIGMTATNYALKVKLAFKCNNAPEKYRKSCVIEVASTLKDFKACKMLSGASLADCAAQVALEQNNVKVCKLLDRSLLDDCVAEYNEEVEGSKVCKIIPDENARDECYMKGAVGLAIRDNSPFRCNHAPEGMVDDCVFELARQTKEISACKALKWGTPAHKQCMNIIKGN